MRLFFSDQAPDIEQYKEYYESIDPDNAELLYKQVVEQQQTDSKISDYVKGYSPDETEGSSSHI